MWYTFGTGVAGVLRKRLGPCRHDVRWSGEQGRQNNAGAAWVQPRTTQHMDVCAWHIAQLTHQCTTDATGRPRWVVESVASSRPVSDRHELPRQVDGVPGRSPSRCRVQCTHGCVTWALSATGPGRHLPTVSSTVARQMSPLQEYSCVYGHTHTHTLSRV